MQTDGLFTINVVEVPFKKYNQPISFYPVSDIHRDSPNFAEDLWQSFLDDVKQDNNQKIFGLFGDTFDAVSSSERRHILTGNSLHDSTLKTWEGHHRSDIDKFIKEVSPIMKGKTVCVLGGNHFYQFSDNSTTDGIVSSALDSTYCGVCGYIILVLKYDKNHSHVVKIFAHHGASDAKMNRLMATVRCDMLLMGHLHKINAEPRPDIDCVMNTGGKWKIVQHETRRIRLGSFLRSYADGKASYAVDAAYAPATIGCPRIIITPRRKETRLNGVKRTDNRWVDIKVEV